MKRCPIPDCDELIPMDAETCDSPVCPCCGQAHTRLVRGKAVMCSGCVELRAGAAAKRSDANFADPHKGRSCAQVSEQERQRLDAVQRQIDRDIDANMIARSGLTLDPGRRLSAEEIAAIQHKITPIHQVKRCSYGDRRTYGM